MYIKKRVRQVEIGTVFATTDLEMGDFLVASWWEGFGVVLVGSLSCVARLSLGSGFLTSGLRAAAILS